MVDGLPALVQTVLRAVDTPIQETQSATDKNSSSSSSEHHRSEGQEQPAAEAKRIDWRGVWEVMMAQFLLSSSMLVYRADFAVTVSQRFGTSNTANGYISSLASIVGTLTGFSVGHIADKYSGNTHRLFQHAAAAQSVCLLVTANASTLTLFTAGHAALSFATAISRVAAIQTLLVHGTQHHAGALIGTGATIMSVARMLAPTVSGISQEVFSYYGPVILSVTLSLAGTVVLLFMPSKAAVKMRTE